MTIVKKLIQAVNVTKCLKGCFFLSPNYTWVGKGLTGWCGYAHTFLFFCVHYAITAANSDKLCIVQYYICKLAAKDSPWPVTGTVRMLHSSISTGSWLLLVN